MYKLKILLFGSPQIILDDVLIQVDTKKAIALLSYIAVEARPIRRDTLAALLYANYDTSRAKGGLRRTLSSARKGLQKEWLSVDSDVIALQTSDELFVDVRQFREKIDMAKKHDSDNGLSVSSAAYLEEAVVLYQEDFMAGFSLRDCPAFDDWQVFEAEALRYEFGNALERLVNWHHQEQTYEHGIPFARRWYQLDPYQDKAIYNLMVFYARTGQRNVAMKTYEDYRVLLRDELDAEPLDETKDLYEQISQDQLRPKLFEITPAPETPPTNIPTQARPFIGRANEIAHLSRLFNDPTCRLITITGPGGMGKTSLAHQIIEKNRMLFPHGSFEVVLETETNDEKLIADIAAALRYRFYKGTPPKQQLFDYLRGKVLALLLDNFENYIGDVSLITELLYNHKNTQVIVTSQRPLGLAEEWLFQLRGLPVPEAETTEDVTDAVRLFVTTAQKRQWDFELDIQRPSVFELCRILEGMPLAIEMTASQVTHYSCTELETAIAHNIDLLKSSYQNVPERHRSIRAIFDYTWALLGDDLQIMLLGLTVFRGGFSLEMATAIVGVQEEDIVTLQHHILISERSDRYYEIPGILKLFLSEKPFISRSDVERKHSEYFAQLTHEQDLECAGRDAGLEVFEMAFQNIEAGWQHALQHQRLDLLQIYADNLHLFYDIRGRYAEGRTCFEAAAEQIRRFKPVNDNMLNLLAFVQARAGLFNRHLGNMDNAFDCFSESIGLQERLSNWVEMAWSLNNIGVLYLMRGERSDAYDVLTESLSLAQNASDELQIARTTANLGIMDKMNGNYTAALERLMVSCDIYQRHQHQRMMAATLTNIGNVYLGMDDLSQASNFYEQSYESNRKLEDQWGTACALINWGRVSLLQEQLHEARHIFDECLAICDRIGKQSGIAKSHYYIGEVLSAESNIRPALMSFADALRLERKLGNWPRIFDILKQMALLQLQHGDQKTGHQMLQIILRDARTPHHMHQEISQHLSAEAQKIKPTLTTEQLCMQLEMQFNSIE